LEPGAQTSKLSAMNVKRAERMPKPTTQKARLTAPVTLLALAGLVTAACTPTVRVEAPKEPITINLNIKLDADVRLRVEEQAKQDIQSKPNIF